MRKSFRFGALVGLLGIAAGAVLLPNVSSAGSPESRVPVMAFCSQEEDANALKELWTQQLQEASEITKTLKEAASKSCVLLEESEEGSLADTVRLYLLSFGRGSVVMALRTERGRGGEIIRGWLVAIASTFLDLEDLNTAPSRPDTEA